MIIASFANTSTSNRYDAYDLANSFVSSSPKVSKIKFQTKEIFNSLYNEEKHAKPMVERITQMKLARSNEKDLRRKLILTSKEIYFYY